MELRDGSPRVPCSPARLKMPTAVYTERGQWLVEPLVLGEGSNKLSFKKGVRHACEEATASVEAFPPIQWDAELFAGAREGDIVLSTYAVYGARLETSGEDEEWPECIIPARHWTVSRQPRHDEVRVPQEAP